MLAERQIKRVLTPVTSPKMRQRLISGRDDAAGQWARVRVGRRPERLTPSFLIVGAQKAGTTFLYQELVRHPMVRPALTKEVHYFDDRYDRWREAYAGFFPAVSADDPGAITGEASPGYIFHPRAIERIARDLPDVRLILLLRDPVRRAFSQYHHELRLGYEDAPTFAEALAREDGRLDGELERMLEDEKYVSFAWRHHAYCRRGHYLEQIARAQAEVPPEQLLILRSEDLYADSLGVVAETFAYLGLPAWVPDAPGTNDMAAPGAARIDPGVERELRARFAPLNAALEAHLGRPMGWDA